IVLTRKHPELAAFVHAGGSEHVDEAALERMLDAVLELEKPDLSKLGALRTGDESFATVYRRALLHPLYAGLLDAAYRLGVREAAVAPFDVSIALPVHDAGVAQRTLTRLAAVTDGAHFEVIVVDDGSTDETRAVLATLGGDVQVVRNPEARGVVAAWNQAAERARGRHVVFLGAGASPERGWLRELVASADADPDVAAVGSAAPIAGKAPLLVRRDRCAALGGFREGTPEALAEVDPRPRARRRHRLHGQRHGADPVAPREAPRLPPPRPPATGGDARLHGLVPGADGDALHAPHRERLGVAVRLHHADRRRRRHVGLLLRRQ